MQRTIRAAAGLGAALLLLPLPGAALVTVGALDTSHAVDVEIVGPLAYVADSNGGLRIVDVSDPTLPVELGAVATYSAKDVKVVGSLAYVADWSFGLRVIDVSDPTAPFEVGIVDTPDHALAVAVVGALAYVADDHAGLRIIDVSDPTAPVEIGSIDTPSTARDVEVAGTLAFVADGFASGVRVIDVSDPTMPAELGVAGAAHNGYDIAMVGPLLCMVDFYTLRVFDVSNPFAPAQVGILDIIGGHTLEVVGDRGYLLGNGVSVVDLSDPTLPVLAGSVGMPASGVAAAGGFAHVAAGTLGLRVVDLSLLSFPARIGGLDTPGRANELERVGDLLYVADGHWWPGTDSALRVIDVSDPAAPVEVGSFDTPGRTWDVAVSASLAYLADDAEGLRIVDVSDPAAPVEVSVLDTPGMARDLVVADGLVYLADGASGLRVIDVSDPASPVEIGALESFGHARKVEHVDGLLYVADWEWDAGLRVVDVSDPTAPRVIGAFDMPGSTYGVEVAAGRAYLGNSGPGGASLQIIDVSDPTAPFELGSIRTRNTPTDVAAVGDLVFASLGQVGGVAAIDVSDPTAPFELGIRNTTGDAEDIVVTDGLVYLADGEDGLVVIDFGPEYLGGGDITVEIDVLPRREPNFIDPNRRRIVPVALLASEDFDVTDVDVTTLAFGPAGASPVFDLTHPFVFFLSHRDVDGDGDRDLVSHYRTRETGIAVGDTEACLRGRTLDGTPFEGCDAIVTARACGHGYQAALVVPPLLWAGGRVRRRRQLRA